MARNRLTKREQHTALLRKRHREEREAQARRDAERVPLIARTVWMTRNQLRRLYP